MILNNITSSVTDIQFFCEYFKLVYGNDQLRDK